MLSAQVPADPDEPFFILSLTEIPVGSLAEMGDSSSEPLPLLPVTELSQQQRFGNTLHMPGLCLAFFYSILFFLPFSVSGECLDKPLAHVIVSTEGSGLVTVGESPLNPAASQVNTAGTQRGVTQHRFFSFLTYLSFTFIRVLTLTTQWIHTVVIKSSDLFHPVMKSAESH